MQQIIYLRSCSAVLLLPLLASICFLAGPVHAQYNGESGYSKEEIRTKSKLNKEDWEKTGREFDYSQEKPPEEQEPPEELERRDEQVNRSDASQPWSADTRNIIKYSLFGIIIIVLAVIAYYLILGGSVFANKKVKSNVGNFTVEDVEDNLHEVDVERFLQDALVQKEYRLAIRLYYLAIIKALSLKGTIIWKKDKTNGVYLREMRQHPHFRDFQQATLIYEYAWFNNDEPFDGQDFETVRPKFRSLLDAVEQRPNPQNL